MNNATLGSLIRKRVEIEGSFLVNGSSDPDGIRDGNTNTIESVVLTSTGLFTVTLAEHILADFIPSQWITEEAWLNPVDATPVLVCACGVVEGSWDQAARTFQILTTKVADTGASAYFDPAPENPDDNSRVCFRLVGTANYPDQED
jgi:hypothetical protein